MSSQPEPRRRSLRIIESHRKVLRDAIREIVHEYKRAQRRQRWRDAIWDIIQQKRAKQARLKRMVRKMAEERQKQKAAELRARIRERQEDRRCVVCLCYHAPTELHLQRMYRVHAVHTKATVPLESAEYHNPYVVLQGARSYGLCITKHALAIWPRQQTSLAVHPLSTLSDG